MLVAPPWQAARPGPAVPAGSTVTRLPPPVPRGSHGAAGIVLLLDHLARNGLEGGKELERFLKHPSTGIGAVTLLQHPQGTGTFGAQGSGWPQTPSKNGGEVWDPCLGGGTTHKEPKTLQHHP